MASGTKAGRLGLVLILASLVFAGVGMLPSAYALPSAPNLGSAINYSVLANTGITCAAPGPTVLPLVYGSFPTATYTGFPAYCTGTVDSADASAAQTALGSAISGVSTSGFTAVTTADLGTQNVINSGGCTTGCYTPGGYLSGSSLAISTPITLDGAGVYIFYATLSTLTTSGTANVILSNGATASGVFWVLTGSTQGSATVAIPAGNAFIGNILAGDSITLAGAATATFNGRALANNGAVSITTAIPTFTSPPVFTSVVVPEFPTGLLVLAVPVLAIYLFMRGKTGALGRIQPTGA